MAQAPVTQNGTQRGVFLTVDDIERLAKAFQSSIKPSPSDPKAPQPAACGIIVCGNGAAV